MLRNGFLDEAKELWEDDRLDFSMPSARSVGYRQAFEYLNDLYSYDEFVEKGIAATRQLAKRQLTWIRNWKGEVLHVDPFESEFNINKILDYFVK